MHPDYTIRLARLEETPALNAMIKMSAQTLSQNHYSKEEIEALNQYVFSVDTTLIADQTYFVIEKKGEIVACGGFSKRKKLFGGDQYAQQKDEFLDPTQDPAKIRAFFVHPNYARQGLATELLAHCEQKASEAGFTSLELMATLPGIPFYRTQGFIAGDATTLTLENGVPVKLVPMHKKNFSLKEKDSNKRSLCTDNWNTVKRNKIDGLTKGCTFPEVLVYDPKNNKDRTLSSFYSQDKKTMIIRQPGFTPAEGYWGEKHDKNTWIGNPGAAGCGAHADGWIETYKKAQKAGFEVVLLTSEKTPDEWVAMLKAKSLPFPAVSLTEKSIATLNNIERNLGFKNPSFEFEGKTILPRACWVVDADGTILDFKDNSGLKPEQCKNDATTTLEENVVKANCSYMYQ